MTLAPVIGGVKGKGLENILWCSGKKRTRYRGLQKVSMVERGPQTTLLCILPGQYLTVISIIMKNGQVNQIKIISKPP